MICTRCKIERHFTKFVRDVLCIDCFSTELAAALAREKALRDALQLALDECSTEFNPISVLHRMEQALSTHAPRVWAANELKPLMDALREINSLRYQSNGIDERFESACDWAERALVDARSIGLIKEESK